MAFIREWIVTIISIIIFVTFIEILIPNSNYKRYINVVVGFLLIIVILTPLTKFINGEINIEEEILKASNKIDLLTAENRINNIQYSNNEIVVALYKNEISKQIKNYIQHNTKYIVTELHMEIEEDNNSVEFGLIKNFNINLEEKIDSSKSTSKTIEPVQINVLASKIKNNTVKTSSILINNEDNLIKEYISNLYNVSNEDINIYVLKNN